MIEDEYTKDAKKAMRRLRYSRFFPTFTDPWSRHVRIMAEGLLRKGGYPMFQDEPAHCAHSLLVTVEELWKAREEIARLNKLYSLSKSEKT